ncbi:hypothetical protein MN113_16330 [Pseudomonas veronii]|uniref:hypothetical protein n=1 Tax=Pseudomonas veronii TaxID=76761 RepID=UPI0021C19F29|nr:hypothetical protein [Pseudomonas veronii]MCT8962754.1 hypothetical protein [Pseudomonas veronii]
MGLELTPKGLFVALEDEYFLYDKGEVRHRTPWGFGTLTCLCCDREGRVWAAIRMGSGQWKVGEVSRDGTLTSHWQISEAIGVLCWDSPRQQLFALAPESGSVYRLRSAARCGGLLACPRARASSAGWLWMRMAVYGPLIVKFDYEGNLERMLGVPVASPTDLCFGAVDGRTLFVTSSRQAVSRQELENAPWSGTVMSTPAGSHGAPAPLTRGPA